MSEPEAASTKSDLEALKALEADAPELERIVGLLDRFNVFETIGFVGQELVHSRFLAFLLDPRQKHDLGDLILKRMLREALASADKPPLISLYGNLDGMDLSETVVRREHQYVDLLLTNEAHGFAVIIENKIWTTEHSDQLDRYYRTINDRYPSWRVFGVYLTPFGDPPSHEAYLPFSYGQVCEVVDDVLGDRDSVLNPEVRMTMNHYTDLVGRHIVGDSEITRLCQQIYQRHKRAFDLVYEHRPDSRTQIRPVVEDLVRQHPRLEQEVSSNRVTRFGVKEWNSPVLLSAKKDKKRNLTGSILLFGAYNLPDSLDLGLYMMPGPNTVRQRILDMVRVNTQVFSMPSNAKLDWLRIYSRTLLRPQAYEDLDDEKREEEIRKQWDAFLAEDLPRIEEALKNEAWIWKSEELDEAGSSQESRFVWGDGDIVITKRPEDED